MRRFKKGRILILLLSVILFLSVLSFTNVLSSRNSISQKNINNIKAHNLIKPYTLSSNHDIAKRSTGPPDEKYIMKIEAPRINTLFKILQEQEQKYAPIIKHLKLISFENIVNKNSNENYKNLAVENKNVVVTNDYVEYLNKLSDLNSFTDKRNRIHRAKISNVSF